MAHMEPQCADDLPSNSSVLTWVSCDLCQIVHPASVTFSSTLCPRSLLSFIPYTTEIFLNLPVLSASTKEEPQIHTLILNIWITVNEAKLKFLLSAVKLLIFFIMEIFTRIFLQRVRWLAQPEGLRF